MIQNNVGHQSFFPHLFKPLVQYLHGNTSIFLQVWKVAFSSLNDTTRFNCLDVQEKPEVEK